MGLTCHEGVYIFLCLIASACLIGMTLDMLFMHEGNA